MTLLWAREPRLTVGARGAGARGAGARGAGARAGRARAGWVRAARAHGSGVRRVCGVGAVGGRWHEGGAHVRAAHGGGTCAGQARAGRSRARRSRARLRAGGCARRGGTRRAGGGAPRAPHPPARPARPRPCPPVHTARDVVARVRVLARGELVCASTHGAYGHACVTSRALMRTARCGRSSCVEMIPPAKTHAAQSVECAVESARDGARAGRVLSRAERAGRERGGAGCRATGSRAAILTGGPKRPERHSK